MWHPYTSAARRGKLWSVASAKGVELTLESGETVIDGMSSWWAAVHGYNHPVLNEAVIKQLEKCAHVMFGGLTHRPAVELCETLVEAAPGDLNRVFLCDSGSVSVEVAMKLALQYWKAQGLQKKTRFAALRSAYHGDTFGAMSCCDPVNGMHAELFDAVLPKHLFLPAPDLPFGWSSTKQRTTRSTCIDEMERMIAEHADSLAALIVEPVVQGAGGMRIYDPAYIQRAADVCRQNNVLFIVDEIATAFGRTGTHLFASDHAGVEPDIACVGKALTGGYMSMAATLATDRVAMVDKPTAPPLMHGPTFMGNPLAAAVANASFKLLTSDDYKWQSKVAQIEKHLISGLAPCAAFPAVRDVRVLGAIGVVELKDDSYDHAILADKFVQRGVWLRSFRNLVYTMPPFIISPADLGKITSAIVDVLATLPPPASK